MWEIIALIPYWFPESLKLVDAPRWVIVEYDRLHRFGELLQATDEFRGSRTAAKTIGNKASSHGEVYMLFDMIYVGLWYIAA